MPSGSRVTTEGLEGARPDRETTVGVNIDGRRRGRGEQPMVPDATFTSYYGQPILNQVSWKAPDIPAYLFLGGVAGTSSVIAAGADFTRRPGLARAAKVGAAGAVCAGMLALVHDLGRPSRFANMLRVFKPTSPMSVGSWLLAAYTPAAGVAAVTAVTSRFRRFGILATASAALLGPAVASYTGALVSDTAVPAWHDAYREMPFLFAASGAGGAAGLSLLSAPIEQNAPARIAALAATAAEMIATRRIERRLGGDAKPYTEGTGGAYMHAARALTAGGALVAAVAGGKSRVASALGGAALVAGSFCTKMGVFEAGRASITDPEYTVRPQRERLEHQ